MKELNGIEVVDPIILNKSNTISDALNTLHDKQWMIISVVDNEGRISGIVSPGDLRKSILNGKSLSTSLEKVMNIDPIYIRKEQINKDYKIEKIVDDITQRYNQTNILYAMIPVVSKDMKPICLINMQSLTSFNLDSNIKLQGKTVLIVGGAGYIGSVLTRMLLNIGWNVRILDKILYTDHSLKDIRDRKFTLIKGDAANIDDIVSAVEGVDAVVYLAELVGDPACSFAPQAALKTNYLAVTSMAHLCSHLNINRFIYTSSCSVYGASSDSTTLLDEHSALQPVSLYARMKVLVEQSILSVCNLPNPLFAPTVLRLATVFGYSYRPRFDLVVNTFAKHAITNGKIEVFGGEQWRPNVHVKDVAAAIITVLNSPTDKVRAEVFNVGSDRNNYTINNLADIVKEVFPNINVVKKDDVVDQRNYRVSFKKIEEALGYKARKDIIDGIKEIKDAYDRGEIKDFDAPHFSNFRKLQELKYV